MVQKEQYSSKYQKLGKKTAEVYGITIGGRDKWKTLIQNGSKEKFGDSDILQ